MKFPLPFILETDSDHPADLPAFLLIIYLVVRANPNKIPIPRLFKIIAQDATYYFLIIFTSHFVLELTLLFATVRTLSQYSTTH